MHDDDLPPVGTHLTSSAAVLRAGLALSGLEFSELHLGYLTVGGTLSPVEVEEVLEGVRVVSGLEHDYLAQALNDHFTARGQDHPVAYAEDLDQDEERPS